MWRQVNRSHLDAGEAGIGARAALAEPADGKMHSEREQAKPTHRAELRALRSRASALVSAPRSVRARLTMTRPTALYAMAHFVGIAFEGVKHNQPSLRGRIASIP